LVNSDRAARKFLSTGAIAVSLALCGCNTEDQLAQQQLESLRAEAVGLKDLQAYLATKPNFSGPGAVNIFLSTQVINSILAGADGVAIPLPSAPDASVTLKKVRAAFRYGYPLLSVDAVASKKGVPATLTAIVVAKLEPYIDPQNPKELLLRIRLESIVPSVQWSIFDFKIRGLVQDLAKVELTDQLRTLGVIRVPIAQTIPINVPASETPFSFTGASGVVQLPNLSMSANASVKRVITLPDGLHVIGQLSL
jgi:hypothetical protein